jgi:hypothetical protein
MAKSKSAKTAAHFFTIGKPWLLRTVTHHQAGIIKAVNDKEILLKGGTVVWVADSGRFSEMIKTGVASETEVYGDNDVVVGRGSIIDATELKNAIQVVTK